MKFVFIVHILKQNLNFCLMYWEEPNNILIEKLLSLHTDQESLASVICLDQEVMMCLTAWWAECWIMLSLGCFSRNCFLEIELPHRTNPWICLCLNVYNIRVGRYVDGLDDRVNFEIHWSCIIILFNFNQNDSKSAFQNFSCEQKKIYAFLHYSVSYALCYIPYLEITIC